MSAAHPTGGINSHNAMSRLIHPSHFGNASFPSESSPVAVRVTAAASSAA